MGTEQKLLGPPLIAKAAAVVAGLMVIGALVRWDTASSLSTIAVAAPAVWRLLRLGVTMTDDEVVVKNLITTHRITRENARFARRKSDLRTRLFWGGHVIPPHDSIPKMADDNMTTETNVMYIANVSNKENDAHVDAGFGLSPTSYEEVAERFASLFNPAEPVD